MSSNEWFGHPRGLSTLFFTEMWERFSYYGMRAILILFMVAPAAGGGLGWTTARAASVYGLYTMAVYASAIPGGWIADRFLGHYRSVLLGGITIALGHFSMAVPRIETFFLGLALIVVGTGLLKPNVSSMVGTLYAEDDARRDSAYSIYYMGINIGATASPLVCGWLGQRVNWHVGFGAAGVGMVVGLVQYVMGRMRLIGPMGRMGPIRRMGPVGPMTSDDRKRLAAIAVFFLFAIIFFGAFEQAGSTLTLFADRYTRLSFPSSWFQALQPLFVITLAPVFAWLWIRLGAREPSGAAKFSMGLLLVGAGFLLLVPAAFLAQVKGVKVSPMWLTSVYLIHTFGELCLSPVGLSLVSKLSPPRLVGMMMGLWFLGAAIGNYVAGWVASFFDVVPVYRLFALVFIVTAGASLVVALLIRPMRKLAVAAAMVVLCVGTLHAEPYAVGYKLVQRYDYSRVHRVARDLNGRERGGERARPIAMSVWYPAEKSAAAPMTFGDYAGNEDLFTFGILRTLTPEQRAALRALPAAAVRDAKPLPGKFPLIVYSLGSPALAYGTPELLASRGYVVVQAPRLGAFAGLPPDNFDALDLTTKIRDTEFLLDAMHDFPSADVHNVGALGFSAGGRWALALAMENPDVHAVVSLDTVMLFNDQVGQIWRKLPLFQPDAVRAPVLHLIRREWVPQEDLSMWESMRYADRTRVVFEDRRLDHFDFQSAGRDATRAGARAEVKELVEKTYDLFSRATVAFFDAHLKHDAAAKLPEDPLATVTHTAAAPAPPALMEVLNAIDDGDVASVLRADVALPEFVINTAGYNVLGAGDVKSAVALFLRNVEAHPRSANAYDSLGDGLLAAGDAAGAAAAAKKALALLDADTTIEPSRKELVRESIKRKLR